MSDTPKATIKVLPKTLLFQQHEGARLTQGLWLITMATVLMAALLRSLLGGIVTQSCTRTEDWEDRGWPELSLQAVVCNASWESHSPHSLRQGINQAHGWDKRRPSAAPLLPPSLPGIDWRLLSIDLRPFSVISCPQSHLGDRYRVNFRPQLSVIINCAACRHLHKSTPTKTLSAAMWFVSPFPALHLHPHSCVTTGPGSYGATVLLSAFCFGRHIPIERIKPRITGITSTDQLWN